MPTSHPAEEGTVAPRWLDSREQAAWRAFLEMQGKLNAQINRELQQASGLSTPDFSVLVQLSEHVDGRMRVLELARALGWEKSRLSHQLTRMTQRGLVDRSHCSEDRRGAVVVLTDRGRATVEQAAPPHVEAVRRLVFDRLTDMQVDVLAEIAHSVVAAVDATCGGAAGPACGEDPDPACGAQ